MNSLTHTSRHILEQLACLVLELQDAQYTTPAQQLSGATIGEHYRHTLEFFICLTDGISTGIINYDKRKRSKTLEQHRLASLSCIQELMHKLSEDALEKKALRLEVSYRDDECLSMLSTTDRELVYVIEHAIHHMALLKIGVREIAPWVTLPEDFGVAYSTLRFKKTETSYS
jgi:uncharacterized damage-inducible protein DinB